MNRNYRLLDQIAVALERGVPDPFEVLQGEQRVALGAVIEAVSIAWTTPEIAPFLHQSHLSAFVKTVRAARRNPLSAYYGRDGGREWGFICLADVAGDVLREPLYAFELAARKAMQFGSSATHAKANICGALQEMVDNILEHSEAPTTGIAGFLGTSQEFEMSIGDAGVGMLASLQKNPAFSYLSDAGSAMLTGLADGNSRYGMGQDRGFGFGTLFRALNSLDAELRFRTGDYALEAGGRSPSLRNARVRQRAGLQGFVVSLKLTV